MRDLGTRGGPSRAGHWEEGGAKPPHGYSRSRTLYHGGTPLEGTKKPMVDGRVGLWAGSLRGRCQLPEPKEAKRVGWVGGVDSTGALPTGQEAACLPEDCGEDA